MSATRPATLAFVVGAALAAVATYLAVAPAPPEAPAAPSASQTYTCSMHPQVRQSEPGSCPLCGMDLTPVHPHPGGDDPGEPGIAVEARIRQSMGVRTGRVRRGPLAHSIRAVARVVADERAERVVTTKYRGWVERVFADETGQRVRRGQPLFSVYSPDLVAGQQEYLLALRQGDRGLIASAKDRLRFWDLTEQQLARIAEAGRPQKTVVVHAPMSGYVVDKHAMAGDRVRPETPLYRIVDLSKVWVHADVYAYELPWLSVGQPATLELSYVRGQRYEARVAYVYPTVDEASRTIRVRLELDNPELALRPGMFGTVRIESQARQDVLQVPAAAVLRTGRRDLVFVAEGEGRFSAREVRLGEEGADGALEIRAGLSAGERIVTSGQFLLDSESQLEEAVEKLSGPASRPSSGPASGPASRPSSGPALGPASRPSAGPASGPASRPGD